MIRKISHSAGHYFRHFIKTSILVFRDWSLITKRGGYKMRKIAGPLPPQNRVKLFAPHPLLKSRNLFVPPPPSTWLNLQATTLRLYNYPQTCCAPPSAWVILPPPPPPLTFRRGKTSHAAPPPPLFCSLPPLPVISDQSLMVTCWTGLFQSADPGRSFGPTSHPPLYVDTVKALSNTEQIYLVRLSRKTQPSSSKQGTGRYLGGGEGGGGHLELRDWSLITGRG